MTAIRVVRQGKKGKTDRLPLYVEFYINREKIRIAVRLSVTSKEWDEQNEVIKGRDKESKDKNLIISNIRSRVSDIFVRARLKNETLTKESFFRQYNNPSDFGTFFDFARVYLKQISKTISFGTWKHHVSIIKKLETFAPGLVFSEITHEFLLSFFAYLRKIGNMDSTAWRNMATIKIYVGAAIRGGYMDQDLTLVGLELLSYLFKSIGMKSSMVSFSTPNKDILKQIADRFNSKDYLIVSYEMETQHTGETEYYQVTMVIKSKRNNDEGHLLSLIQEFPDVTVQRIE